MTKALAIKDLRKTYAGKFEALKGIDLEVETGDFFALLGPNGAGKSTTISIITSLVTKSSGKVEVFGVDTDDNHSLVKKYIGLVPQEFNFNQFEPLTDILTNQAGYYGIPRKIAVERCEKYLKLLDLWDKRKVSARQLSGGMKRRLMIARAMVHEPRMLILDEPTAGVDIEIRRAMWGFLQEINANGTTIILTTHYLEEAESLCKNVAIINKGEIIENTSMRKLLNSINQETFVLDLSEPVTSLPTIDGIEMKLIDEDSIELTVERKHELNSTFTTLSEHGILVSSMRNKANRLEEFFIRRIGEDSVEA